MLNKLGCTPVKHLLVLQQRHSVLQPQLFIELSYEFLGPPVDLWVIILIFTGCIRYPSAQRRQQWAQFLKNRQIVLIKTILAKVFIAVVQLGKNRSAGLFLVFNLMRIDAWKVQNMCGKVVMFSLGHMEDCRAVTAGEFKFLKPRAAMVVASGMMEHHISEASSIDFPSLHHQMHIHQHLSFGNEPFPDHEESDP